MNINIFSAGETSLLRIRYMGCNRKPYLVNIGPMLRESYIIHYLTAEKATITAFRWKGGRASL